MGRLDELARAVSDGRMAPPDDEQVAQACPFLWEMLTVDRWGDGKERLLPVIKVERTGGGYRVTIQDDSLCVQKRCFVRQWADILPVLEKVLADPEVPWEAYRSYRNKAGPPVLDEKPTRRRKR